MPRQSSDLASSPIPPSVLRASATLRLAGNIGFWVQLVLGVVAALILLFASTSVIGGNDVSQSNNFSQGSNFGIFCATGGILALMVSIFFFFRYRTIAQYMLTTEPTLRPKKSYTLQIIKLGLISNLIGMAFAIVGAETLAGLLLGKFLNLPQGAITSTIDASKLLRAGEFMIILANTHTIASHFTGIVVALLLLNRINR